MWINQKFFTRFFFVCPQQPHSRQCVSCWMFLCDKHFCFVPKFLLCSLLSCFSARSACSHRDMCESFCNFFFFHTFATLLICRHTYYYFDPFQQIYKLTFFACWKWMSNGIGIFTNKLGGFGTAFKQQQNMWLCRLNKERISCNENIWWCFRYTLFYGMC